MSKSIAIKEEGTSKTITVDKLRTKLAGGKSCTWIPKDDAETATAVIRKNGKYKASQLGLLGISSVRVQRGESGTAYEITGPKSVGSFKAVNVAIKEGDITRIFNTNKLQTDLSGGGTCQWVPEDKIKLGSKYITKNGTYNAADDKLYGYSSLTVSVKDEQPYTPDDPYIPDPSPGPTPGPTPTADAPSYIRVTTPPNNINYSVGDTIDYTGIQCTMYDIDGNVFTDNEHPNGILVQSELTFPVDKAPEPTT